VPQQHDHSSGGPTPLGGESQSTVIGMLACRFQACEGGGKVCTTMSHTLLPTLDELVAAPERARELPPGAACEMLAKLASLQPILLIRALAGDGQEPLAETRLLSIPETAARLNIPVAHAYELARRGEIPTLRIGKKYLRVCPSTLERWLAEKRLDNGISVAYSKIHRRGKHDRRRVAPDSSTAGPDASATGRASRSPLE